MKTNDTEHNIIFYRVTHNRLKRDNFYSSYLICCIVSLFPTTLFLPTIHSFPPRVIRVYQRINESYILYLYYISYVLLTDAAATRRQQRVNKDRLITLLVVDDENFEW